MKSFSFHALHATLVHIALTLCLGATAPDNLIENPGFEQGAQNKVPGWYTNPDGPMGQVVWDDAVAHSGRASIRLCATAPRLRTAQTVRVAPNTTYKISGWVRTDRAAQAEIRVIRNIDRAGKPYLCEVAPPAVAGTQDWRYVEALFDSADGTRLSVWLWMPGGSGSAWFDDIRLEPGGKLESPNLLRNSTFSICTNPGIPDWWGIPCGIPFNRKDWTTGKYYGVDDAVVSPVAGTRALRMVTVDERVYLFSSNYLRTAPGGTYTISVYMRTDGAELPVQFGLSLWRIPGRAAVTRNWARYTVTGELTRALQAVVMLKQPGTLWIAAPQIELGAEATPYKAAHIDGIHAKGGPSVRAPDEVPAIVCPLLDHAPKIDGKLDRTEWAAATRVSGFRRHRTGEKASVGTEGFIARDAEHLYIGVRCHEPNVDKLEARVLGHDDPAIFRDDCVEVFLCVDPDSERYYHFVTNAAGARYDERNHRADWDVNWTSSAGREPDVWCVEMAVPLRELDLSESADVWRINLCRDRWTEGKVEYMSWSHPNGFHQIENFARLSHVNTAGLKRQSAAGHAAPENRLRVLLELSHYIAEQTASVRLVWAPAQPVVVHLEIRDASGKVRANNEVQMQKAGTRTVALPIHALAPGTHEVVAVTTTDPDRRAQVVRKLVKLPPNPISVPFNRFTRTLMVDGKPFLARLSHMSLTPDSPAWQYEQLRDYGFNANIRGLDLRKDFGKEQEAVLRRTLDRCAEYDLKTVLWITGITKMKEAVNNFSFYRDHVLDVVRRLKDHANILAWYVVDEPSKRSWEGTRGYEEQDLVRLRNAVKHEDPYRPVIVNWTPHGAINPGGEPYGTFACTDINAIDYYPLKLDPPPDPMRDFARITRLFDEQSRPLGRTIMFWMQTYGCNDRSREPRPEELRCMATLNWIYNTRMLAYYTCRPLYQPLWEMHRTINLEAEQLAESVFLAPDAREVARGIVNGQVHYVLHRSGGKHWLLAANASAYPAQFSLPLPDVVDRAFSAAVPVFEAGRLKLTRGVLTDSFAPAQARVYRLE